MNTPWMMIVGCSILGFMLTELRRSMFTSDDDFKTAIEFHEERGCESEWVK